MRHLYKFIFRISLAVIASLVPACGDSQVSTDHNRPKKAVSVTSAAQEVPAPSDLQPGEVWEDGRRYFVLNVPNSADLTSPEILMAAEEMGFFDENGIKVNYVGAVPSTQTIPSVLKDLIHTNSGGHVNTTISAIAAGAGILAVAQKTESSQRVPHMVAIVKIDSPIKTAHDLIGKKIGSPSAQGCSGYFHLAYMLKHGIEDPKNAADLLVIKEAVIEQALRQGDVDAALMHKTPEYFENNREFRVLFSDYDIWENRGGGTPFFFRLDFIKSRPDVIRGFTAAMAETANWANAHPRENREITARRTKADLNSITERYYAPDAIIKEESVTVWLDVLKQFKEVTRDVPLDQIYTNEFNPYNKSQGLQPEVSG
ncbi:MAG: ABC transporter substrate-binding protein [Deltaproteobacteria bacterium]|jgi:ABC-type nitrate/sulfonate/bicarbonate transport system substrate-binding protein|nr:ABC transporter substrate-binding protein [Deltaproteobacteria bacterium]